MEGFSWPFKSARKKNVEREEQMLEIVRNFYHLNDDEKCDITVNIEFALGFSNLKSFSETLLYIPYSHFC